MKYKFRALGFSGIVAWGTKVLYVVSSSAGEVSNHARGDCKEVDLLHLTNSNLVQDIVELF